jgi:hypothetical protein
MCGLVLILLLFICFTPPSPANRRRYQAKHAHDILKQLVEIGTPCTPPGLPRASMVGMSTTLTAAGGCKRELSYSARAFGQYHQCVYTIRCTDAHIRNGGRARQRLFGDFLKSQTHGDVRAEAGSSCGRKQCRRYCRNFRLHRDTEPDMRKAITRYRMPSVFARI